MRAGHGSKRPQREEAVLAALLSEPTPSLTAASMMVSWATFLTSQSAIRMLSILSRCPVTLLHIEWFVKGVVEPTLPTPAALALAPATRHAR